ncbi:Asp-tRNA(Asn)/Glu-tRNA(Gln) amidotransferase subunit GatB, partial [Patescibacteria group bacterium]|nr:Asp-tRNA(Asn)/Glu-tRNA(Gln) amidotransferase subunit GatB [Patescibacteria group bacterium]
MTNYEPVIGLEIHAQVNTKTKMFCGCDNDSFQKEPNTNVCPICMGFPGTLPAVNREAYKKGIRAARALNCKIPKFSKFDRKNYFYPDLPKGYQISQFDKPVSENGYVEFEVDGSVKKVGITRLHLEDDAGKLTHTSSGSLCDYNRSGTPLMEIVSEPEIYSTQEASAYARELQKVLRYVGSSDCDMEKGMMRFDVNISIRKKGEKELGTKVEVKNLNSFRSMERTLDYEFKRQVQALENSEEIHQETRGWDKKNEVTVSQRSKEEAQDYRYFPEPDLPPMTASESEEELPELPFARQKRFQEEFNLKDEDAKLLTETPDLA